MKKRKILWMLMIVIILLFTGCKKQENPSVGKVRLNVETYQAGKNQVTHPSVISFEEPWNGYRYWMVYTPYPEANGEEENPSIAVSNDLYKWETPYGMVNPIADNEETGCNELKDGHILYRDDLDRLEVWYLGRVSKNIGGDGESLTLFRKYSSDGVTWSPYEVMDQVESLSPAVIWKDGKYQMWSIGFGFPTIPAGTFVYQESLDGTNWSEPQRCSIDGQAEGLALWHGSVNYDEKAEKYIFVSIPYSGGSQQVDACESEDGIHFEKARTIVKNDDTTLWSHFYRPCLLSENGMQHLFYGVITEENKWYLSYSKGETLEQLQGINEADVPKMIPLEDTVTDTNSTVYICKKVYHSVLEHMKVEVAVFVIIFFALKMYLKKKHKQFALLQLIICVLMCLMYTYLRFRTMELYALVGMISASLIEGVSIYCVADTVSYLFEKKD